MKKHGILIINLILTSFLIISCEDGGKSVIGSKEHDIKSATAAHPEILANGISTTTITAIVYNKKDATVARGAKVYFQTTAGTIEEFGVTNAEGKAIVTLTSAASEKDLTAEITAIVVDTTFSPSKKDVPGNYVITLQVPGYENSRSAPISKPNSEQDNRAKIYVKFLGVNLYAEIDETVLPADGISRVKINVKLRETTSQKAISSAEIRTYASLGSIEGGSMTDDKGFLEVFLVSYHYPAKDTLRIEYGNTLSKQFSISYENPKLTLLPKALQVPADGQSSIQIVANLISHRNTPIENAEIRFSTSSGMIPALALTDQKGNAIVDLTSGTKPDSMVMVIARFHSLKDTAIVSFIADIGVRPNSILLDADPNYIWVKETGNLDQTIISATVLGVNNQPLGNDIGVKFYIMKGPDGGEYIEPSSDASRDTSAVIKTIDGKAKATIRSGIRSGTVQIRAKLVDFPNIFSQTTNIVIRSGPPYMWLDPQKNNVVRDTTTNRTHATLAVECGKHNVAFTNPIQDIKVTAYFGDKYNNPVEEGTAVYFTTTGGIITSDAITDYKGQTTVILQNVNPFPVLTSPDPYQLSALNIPNPNDTTKKLDIYIPDFEGELIKNSKGDYKQNDGVAVLLAYTWGKDQDGRPIKVWTTTRVVYSRAIAIFTAYPDTTVLLPNEIATIEIHLYDINGNPVAAGSSLTVSTTAGELSETNLMPSADRYGFGSTDFETQLVNNLDPQEDEPKTALVKILLDSPNGTGKITIPIYLKIAP